MATTFDPAWLAERGVLAAQALPVPGCPMLLVVHKIGEREFEFLAKLPHRMSDVTPEAYLEIAKRQIEAGIAERHRLLSLGKE